MFLSLWLVASLCKEKSKDAGKKEFVGCLYLKSSTGIRFLVYTVLDSFPKGTGKELMSFRCGLLSA